MLFMLSWIQLNFPIRVLEVSIIAKNKNQKSKILAQDQISPEKLFIYKSLLLLAGGYSYGYLVAFFCHLQLHISLITID